MPSFPDLGSSVRPFEDILPRHDISYISPYSRPKPKVPDAITIGFFNSFPHRFTLISTIIISHPLPKKLDHPYRSFCFPFLFYKYIPTTPLLHRPYDFPMKPVFLSLYSQSYPLVSLTLESDHTQVCSRIFLHLIYPLLAYHH